VHHTLTNHFGIPARRVDNALHALQDGKGILVLDDEGRENEGDLVFAASTLTVPQMAQLIRECSGIVCLCLPGSKVQELGLSMMVSDNTSRFQTAFTVSIEAAEGITTGVSAQDRLATVRAAIKEGAKPEDLRRPGHVFPLQARPGGVLERSGHTEAVVDLMRLAELPPYGVLCELTNPDGTMARLRQVIAFAEKEGYPVVTVDDILRWREDHPE
jgi:3,4-dihydroxy 2-butanone 4-phosphate synthase